MKALVGALNQEKALVGAFSVIVQPVVEPMEHYTALQQVHLPLLAASPGLHGRGGGGRRVLGADQRLQHAQEEELHRGQGAAGAAAGDNIPT